MRRLDIKPGDRFGRLTIIREVEIYIQRNGIPRRQFLCICDCGNKNVVRLSDISYGRTKSCGCLMKEINTIINTKHGESVKTTEYRSWYNMKKRCYNSKNIGYKNYGGRGITVCDRWRNSYENFLEDMGRKPGPEYSIDRINNDGNYEPGNCRWATKYEQANNKRKKKYHNRKPHSEETKEKIRLSHLKRFELMKKHKE